MKHRYQRPSIILLAVAATMVFGSCGIFNPSPQYRIVEPEAVVPSSFLYNPDKTYNEWLDAPQRVYYHKVSIDQIFSDAPFTEFSHELHDIPDDMDLVTLDAVGQTRRQLLWAIAHDYNLKMTLLTTEGGRPATVIVRWRGNGVTGERHAMENGIRGNAGW